MDDPPPPREKWALTPEAFERLLTWLHPDREEAGVKYEEIRSALIRRFTQLGCHVPEELANETMDRVTRKLPEIIDKYKGERQPYFFSVALYVYKEHLRRPIMEALANLDFRDPKATSEEETKEKELLDSCLRHCLDQQSKENREMILEYYRGERLAKKRARKALAERLGINLPNLRLRTQRVRSALRKCILDCMERKAIERHMNIGSAWGNNPDVSGSRR